MTIATQSTPADLTTLQMHLLERSIEWVAQDSEKFSNHFRNELLKHHAGFIEALVPISASQFQFMTLASLTLIIHSVKHPNHLRAILSLLTNQRFTVQQQKDMYHVFSSALMTVLSRVAEDAWCPALQGSWQSVLTRTREHIFYATDVRLAATLGQHSPFQLATRHVHNWTLIVNENEHVRKSLCAYLETQGYGCYEAENGAIALHFLEGTLPIDVVVSDYHMPIMNGLQFLQTLELKHPNQHPPVILSNRHLSQDFVNAARAAGAWAVIAQPYSHEELQVIMTQAIRAQSQPLTHRSRKEEQ